jgi:hypothetical protein
MPWVCHPRSMTESDPGAFPLACTCLHPALVFNNNSNNKDDQSFETTSKLVAVSYSVLVQSSFIFFRRGRFILTLVLFCTSPSIVVSFTIEADQTRRGKPASSQEEGKTGPPPSPEYIVRRPIRGLLTNHGYCVPDPNVPNRLSVWFSGGSLEVQDEIHDLEEWKHLFDENEAPRRDLGELARVLAAKCLLGAHLPHSMEEDGSLTYFLKRPIGGHGQVFVDVLYCDETLRIVRGHRGSIYASIRSL